MKTVFFIDDDKFVTKLYSNLLQNNGIHCVAINSGEEALAQLPVNTPDLVILDLHMPDINGVEVLRFIRANDKFKNLPVIIFSNGYVKELVDEVGDIGAERFFTKLQYKPKQLIAEVEILLAEQQTTTKAISKLARDTAENELQQVPLAKVFATLRKDTRPQAQRICLLHIYKNLCTYEVDDDESLPLNKLGHVLEKLMTDLYDHPDRISESTINTLNQGIQKLNTLYDQAKNKLNSASELENILNELAD